MDRSAGLVNGILENVEFAIRHHDLCPAGALGELAEAVFETDSSVSALCGFPPTSPSGDGPHVRPYLSSIREKISSFQPVMVGEQETASLECVLRATGEIRRALELLAESRL